MKLIERLNKGLPMIQPKVLICDCDGVLSSHNFYYSVDGKVMKRFSADDNDALTLLKPYLDIVFVTGDKRGYKITEKRVLDMKCKIELVSTIKRIDWIKERYNPDDVIYIGDGIFDPYVFDEVGYAITTGDALSHVKSRADWCTERAGGDRALAEACLHILSMFFKSYDDSKLPDDDINKDRDWTV